MVEKMTIAQLTGGARPAPAQIDSSEDESQDDAGEEIQPQDDESDSESGDEGDSPLDASEEDSDDEGDDDSAEASIKAKDGDSDLESLPPWAKEKLADSEKKRVRQQSRADASESDLTKALDLLKTVVPQGENGAATVATNEVTLENLGIDRDTALDADALDKILAHINDQRAVDTRIATNTNLLGRINAATEKHADMQEVATYFNDNNMAAEEEAPLLNNLGRYHFAKAKKLEQEIHQLKADRKTELARKAKNEARKKRNDNIPPILSGSRTQETSLQGLGKTTKLLLQRQKDRARQR